MPTCIGVRSFSTERRGRSARSRRTSTLMQLRRPRSPCASRVARVDDHRLFPGDNAVSPRRFAMTSSMNAQLSSDLLDNLHENLPRAWEGPDGLCSMRADVAGTGRRGAFKLRSTDVGAGSTPAVGTHHLLPATTRSSAPRLGLSSCHCSAASRSTATAATGPSVCSTTSSQESSAGQSKVPEWAYSSLAPGLLRLGAAR